ncbi:MAG: glycosyltransferase [Chitinophagaceae bacterium]
MFYFSWFGISKLNYFNNKIVFLTPVNKNINNTNNRTYTVLVAPLDWGLGHASRCIPLIEKFLFAGFKVIIAAEGDQKILLQSVFPELETVQLNGYNLKYGSTKLLTILKIIFQVPRILIAINEERKWLGRYIRSKHLDIIVSDNRFGLHNNQVLSVFITHQLRIKTSLGRLTDSFIQKMNYHFINQFDYCVVPDAAGGNNLAGALSHPARKPATKLLYTGVLTAIAKEDLPVTNKLLILLSGPEPQRTILEDILLQQLAHITFPAVLIRGLPSAGRKLSPRDNLTVYDYLSGRQLQQVINAAEIIISRSGYSTIMDLLPLGKKCIFIPTPGQAEQEYLAAWLKDKNYACSGLQHNFSLPLLIEEASELQSPDLSFLKSPDRINDAISTFITRLNAKQISPD